jgi:hypothetical protein
MVNISNVEYESSLSMDCRLHHEDGQHCRRSAIPNSPTLRHSDTSRVYTTRRIPGILSFLSFLIDPIMSLKNQMPDNVVNLREDIPVFLVLDCDSLSLLSDTRQDISGRGVKFSYCISIGSSLSNRHFLCFQAKHFRLFSFFLSNFFWIQS